MRRTNVLRIVVSIVVLLWAAMPGHAQRVQFPSSDTTFQPPPSTSFPPPTGYPSTTIPPAQPFGAAPSAAPIPTIQDQSMQNLVGDVQRYGMPFDPYAKPVQYVTPSAPPELVPYTSPPPVSSPFIPFPSITNTGGGFYGSFEATVLEPHVGGFATTIQTVPVTALTLSSNWDFEFSPRVNVGFKGPGGLGIRGRWWFFDHSTIGNVSGDTVPPGMPFSLAVPTKLKVNAIDLEGTQDGQFSNWGLQIAGGVRYATIDYDLSSTILGNFVSINSDFQGAGPTVALAGRRPVMYVDGLAFLVNLRLAFLFGDTDTRVTVTPPAAAPIVPISVSSQDLVQVWETQIGVEYSRLLQNGARVFGGAFLEAQVWEWDASIGIGGGDLGFFGPTAVVGIAR